jgi:hypothetical protein
MGHPAYVADAMDNAGGKPARPSFDRCRCQSAAVTEEFLRAELSDMEMRLNEKINRSLGWNILAMIALAGVIVGAIRV